MMGASAARVAARRNVMDAHSQRRRLRQEREDRLAALAVEVNVALATGRAAMQKAERAAGQALDKMLGMGASVAEVVEWCAGDLTAKDIARLMQAAVTQDAADADSVADTTPPVADDKDELPPSATRAITRGIGIEPSPRARPPAPRHDSELSQDR